MSCENNNQNEQWKLLIFFLDEIRKEKGMTHQDIAVKTGLIRSNVSRFFMAKFKPDLKNFLMIAKAIKVNFFFEDQENKTDLNQALKNAMETLEKSKNKFLEK